MLESVFLLLGVGALFFSLPKVPRLPPMNKLGRHGACSADRQNSFDRRALPKSQLCERKKERRWQRKQNICGRCSCLGLCASFVFPSVARPRPLPSPPKKRNHFFFILGVSWPRVLLDSPPFFCLCQSASQACRFSPQACSEPPTFFFNGVFILPFLRKKKRIAAMAHHDGKRKQHEKKDTL